MGDDQKLPVVIVCGLHSDARREVVEGLLKNVPHSVALHHDLTTAGTGTVHRTLRDSSGELSSGDAPLVNDCACCALREDLIPEVERLAAGGLTALAVLELWDSVEPKAMAEVIAAHGQDWAEVKSVITAVDPALVQPYLVNGDDLAEAGLAAAATDQRTVGDTWARQLEYASVIALVDSTEGGTDEGGGQGREADDEDRALIRQLHPLARQAAAGSDALTALAMAGFDVEAAGAAQHPACALLPQDADEAGVSTLVWRRHRPFHPERLYAALEDLSCAAARSRGRFWLADRPDTLLSWEAAGGALCVENTGPWLASLPDAAWDMVPPFRQAAAALDWHPVHGDCCQHLVFVSPGLDRDGLTTLLDSCLLTDDEYGPGREAWRSLRPAFDSLLDPVH
ncbi:cobalamin biosynthesis protein CobW [Streptomyces finlayi]|uniref:Cobalamin biosynthesis protein CobW n=1 Tax=Streptomyces finlayi TaxID=67296 RepID=A0A7G7BDX4_9ACTN|nr:GTP-binding protein [Streptomyces finlayi]QNE73539.1 cobalamin biosynthesis protein CobW [Streptomyces finlayi]